VPPVDGERQRHHRRRHQHQPTVNRQSRRRQRRPARRGAGRQHAAGRRQQPQGDSPQRAADADGEVERLVGERDDHAGADGAGLLLYNATLSTVAVVAAVLVLAKPRHEAPELGGDGAA